MKIVILNGSPKGEPSVTMQYVKFIQKHYPRHEYRFHNISSRINRIEKNDDLFNEIIADIESCDSIIWSTPVYTLFVPAQYMRFIELIHERNVAQAFKNKSTIVMTTSIHFYDHTAHRYMHAVCDDLEMNYIGYFSAEMDDLRKSRGRETLLKFAKHYFESSEKKFHLQKRYQPITQSDYVFEPAVVSQKMDSNNKKIVLVTDHQAHDTGIQAMIKRFSEAYTEAIDIVNLRDMNIQGGCTGCIKCGYDNNCMYRDDFSSFYRSRILPADVVIFAMPLTGRNMSSKFKEYYDRRFFMNHVPDLKDKQVGFLVSGRMSQMPYLYDFCQGFFECQQANFAGIVCDETGNSDEIDASIQKLAEHVITFSNNAYCQPQTFLGVGGSKIFRDDIWGKLRHVFQADYRYYKKNGAFDFPHKRYKSRLTTFVVMLLTKIPGFRKEFYSRIKTEMYKPHKNIVENCEVRSSS
jgi:multimeric flavodoxin WrbA